MENRVTEELLSSTGFITIACPEYGVLWLNSEINWAVSLHTRTSEWYTCVSDMPVSEFTKLLYNNMVYYYEECIAELQAGDDW